MQRLRYYLLRARRLMDQHGLAGVGRELWAFLCRHWFFTEFLWHWVEFHGVAPRRSAMATIRRTVLGDVPLTPEPRQPLLLYASFDATGVIGAHVRAQLAAYHEAGFRTVFVTTSANFEAAAEAAVRPYCVAAIHRRNLGIDFGSWKTGYEWLRSTPSGAALLEHAEVVLLANDSCYGPFHPLGPVLDRMRAAPDAVYGITRSHEIRPYLQSYFLHFGRQLVASGIFRAFMTQQVRLLGTKVAVARFLEVGGSVWLERHGVPLHALIDSAEEPARTLLARHGLLDPIRDPVGRALLDLGLTPFHKRSNDLLHGGGSAP
ncbi:MAG: rhamnan synthesis F family protein [Gemmatimonadaceae bacterium]